MSERTVFAYFNTPDQAKEAVEKLKSLKLVDYAIERFDGYAGTGIQSLDKIGATINGDFPGLGYLMLGGDFIPDTSILAAASVSASGYSTGGPDNRVTGRDIMLVAIVEEEDFQQAEGIVKAAGAL